MMYFLLILFFGSLLGITFMIGRKLVLIKNGHTIQKEEFSFDIPFLKNWKHITVKNIKKHGYAGLVAVVRVYVRGSNLAKNHYHKIKTKTEEMFNKNQTGNGTEKREVSKFLKMISDYKHKIREIKQKIHEEEKK